METVVAVLERDPTPPRELRPEVPKELETICLKCLEKSPQDRYPSAAALADELDRYLQGEVIDATTLDPAAPPLEPSRARAGRPAGRPLARRPDRSVQLLLRIGQPGFLAPLHDPGRPRPLGRLGRHFPGDDALGLACRSGPRALVGGRHRVPHDRAQAVRANRSQARRSDADGACRDHLARGLSPPDRGLGALVARQARLDHDGAWRCCAYVWLYVDAALRWRAGRLVWKPSPDLQHPNIFLAALFLTGLRRGEAGQADLALEPVL